MDNVLRRLQLCRTGVFGASGAAITAQDLRDVLDTFDGKTPISLGHYMAKDDWWPSWGQVINLYIQQEEDGSSTLVGDIEMSKTLADAIDDGYYPGWSVSLPRNAASGKRYLHHLAFLGATPPKIRDLKWLTPSDPSNSDNVITVGAEGFAFDDSFVFGSMDFADFKGAQRLVAAKTGEDGKIEYVVETQPKTTEIFKKARAVFNRAAKEKIDKALDGKIPPGGKDAVLAKAHDFADRVCDGYDFADSSSTDEQPPLLGLFLDILNAIESRPGVRTGRMDFSDDGRKEAAINRSSLAQMF